MELRNATGMEAGYTLGLDSDGRERVVVAVKGTFDFPGAGEEPRLAEEQVELVMADEFTGEPGFSATLYESDYAPYKFRCDVLVNGSAHALGGRRPVPSVTVGLRIGSIAKFFNVVGDRHWTYGSVGLTHTDPEPFTRMQITYDRAWGGTDTDPADPDDSVAFMPNPVGVGYYPLSIGDALAGKPLPNTEALGRPITDRKGRHRPMSFGPMGRQFQSRIDLAGTYDQDWIDHVFPFLPEDFDPAYFQSAPPDQQMDYPTGGEWLELIGLTPEGEVQFQLPTIDLPVEFTDQDFEREVVGAVCDTIIIEPDQRRFMMIWRASRMLKQNIFEVTQCVVGRMPRGWYRARSLGKKYYPTLGRLVAAREGDE